MEKIALITDSASDISKEKVERYNIRVLPFKIIYSDAEYDDNIDIHSKEVYATLKTNPPTTSLPSMKDMDVMYNELKAQGYTHAIVVTISSKLSGFCNAIKLASQDFPEIKTYVLDSKAISKAEEILICESARMIESGKSFAEITKKLPEIRSRIKVYFAIGTLEYLIRGGRIGKVTGSIAEFLHLKPVVGIDDEGQYYTYTKVRGRKQSIKKLQSIVEDVLDKKKCDVYIMSGDADEESIALTEKLKEYKNSTHVEFGGCLSPVSCVHSGPGLVGVLYYERE